jgi:hypothetical protein
MRGNWLMLFNALDDVWACSTWLSAPEVVQEVRLGELLIGDSEPSGSVPSAASKT